MRKLVASIFVFVTVTCKKAEIATSPQMAVIGRWEIIALGNGDSLYPISQPKAYEEYKVDSVLLLHEYSTAKAITERYYWKGDTLYKGGGLDGKGSLGYKCQFYDDKMQMDLLTATAINYTSVYKRIK